LLILMAIEGMLRSAEMVLMDQFND